ATMDPISLISAILSLRRKEGVPPKTLTQASYVLMDTVTLLSRTPVRDEIQELRKDSAVGSRLNPFTIMAHRRCRNHAIELRVRLREIIFQAQLRAPVQKRFFGPEDEPGKYRQIRISKDGVVHVYWSETPYHPFSPSPGEDTDDMEDLAGATAPAEPTAANVEFEADPALTHDLPLYDESATVGLKLGPAEWGDDAPGLVRALLDSMPQGSPNGKEVTVGRMDECGMLVVQFPSAGGALAFENRWNAQPPPGYESVLARLQVFAAPGYSESPAYD
ncbi:hypothetical protein FB451DRAFT_1262118, partial [Mycena latifolia]